MKNIFVGNLSYSATEDSIRDLFSQYGAVDRVSLVTDRDSGQPRGFGFVEMSSDAEAAEAISKFHGADYDGRAMTVNEAKPMVPREGGGGGQTSGMRGGDIASPAQGAIRGRGREPAHASADDRDALGRPGGLPRSTTQPLAVKPRRQLPST